MSTPKLEGKLALITGCTGGIGKASARTLARHGCAIAVHYNSDAAGATALVAELAALGVRAAPFQADLGEYAGVRALHAAVVEQLGHPDVLFNNAGATVKTIGLEGGIADVSVEEFEKTWRLNTSSAYLLTQLCLPHMEAQGFGRVIFCSSVAAHTGGVIGPHYASSKAALHGILHWVAARYAKSGITCNAVAPALIVDTKMMANPSESHRAKIPVGRFGVPEEIASVVELLVTNSYMTNKIIAADGGWTATGF